MLEIVKCRLREDIGIYSSLSTTITVGTGAGMLG